MTDVRLRRVALAVTVTLALVYAAGLVADLINITGTNAGVTVKRVGDLIFALSTVPFLIVGAIILNSRPRHPIGWILLGISACWGVSGVLTQYGAYGLVTRASSVPGADVAVILASPLWAPPIGLTGTLLLLLFPDGRLPSPRWRFVAWVSVFAIVGTMLVIVLTPGTLADDGYPGVPNPLAVPALKPVLTVLLVCVPLIPLCIVASAVSLVGRYRRSRGILRLQLKWLASGAAVVAAIHLAAIVASLGTSWNQPDTPTWVAALQIIAAPAFAMIPIAMGLAISRYPLYDIDRIINRTLVYGVLTGVLAGVYVGLVLGLGAVARSVGGSPKSPVVVAASTLAAAGLFRPVRQRVQAFIDRRFYRSRYDARRALDAFSASLRDEVELSTISLRLLSLVEETVQPATMSLWLRREASP